MVFCVIVGDMILYVLLVIWLGMSDVLVIGLLMDRRVVIVVFVMVVSYLLILYCDIVKVS